MQSLGPTQSASTTDPGTLIPPIPDNTVNRNFRNRMRRLEISPQSPFTGTTGPSSSSKAFRRRARMDQPWRKSAPSAQSSSLSNPDQGPINDINGGGGVDSNLGAGAGNRESSRAAGNERRGNGSHRTGGRGGGNGGSSSSRRGRGKERHGSNDRFTDGAHGHTDLPGESDRRDGRRKGRRQGSRKRDFTAAESQNQVPSSQYHYHCHPGQYRNGSQEYQSRWPKGHETGSRILQSSLLQGIQSHSIQPTQLTHLTLLRYEFHMDEFLELMNLLPSLQVLDIEIISLLSMTSSSHPQCSSTCRTSRQNGASSPTQDRAWRSSRESSQDSDRMLVDQDENQAQRGNGSRQQSQSRCFPDREDNGDHQPRGRCIQHLRLQYQFSSVRSLTFRGSTLIPELPVFFPNLEALGLEESRCHPSMAPPLYTDHSGGVFYNSPVKGDSNPKASPYGSEYTSSNICTDDDNTSFDPAARTASGQNRLPAMMTELAHTLIESCPSLTRLVLNEPSLINDHQGVQQKQPQQLLLLLRAVPQLRQFVAHTQVVARCPELVETLVEYHHPHLTSFRVVDGAAGDYATHPQVQQQST